MVENDNIKEISFISTCRENSFVSTVRSMIYTDGKVVGEIDKQEEKIDGYFLNRRIFDQYADTLITKTVKLKDANYVIYVYYKDEALQSRRWGGWYPVITDVKLELFDKTNKIALKEAKKTLRLLKCCWLLNETNVLENGEEPVIYKNKSDVHSLIYSKYNKGQK